MKEPKQLIEECKKHLRDTEKYKHEYKKDIRKLITALEKQLSISDVVSSAFLVQHKETLINYGLFSTREKAEKYINKNTDLFGIQEVKIA